MDKSNAFLTSQNLREFSTTNPALFVVQQEQHLLSSVQLCKSHGLQYARLPYPSLSPRVFSNSCPLSQWCYVTNSSSAAPFSFCLQSFPASGSFPMSRLVPSGGHSIRASVLVLPMNIQGWLPLELSGLISLHSKGFSRVFSSTTIWRYQFIGAQPSSWSNSHTHIWLLEKP